MPPKNKKFYITYSTSGNSDVYTVFSIDEDKGTMREEFSPGRYTHDHCISRLYDRAFKLRSTKDWPPVTGETVDTLKRLSSTYRHIHLQNERHGLIKRISDLLEQYPNADLDQISFYINIALVSNGLFSLEFDKMSPQVEISESKVIKGRVYNRYRWTEGSVTTDIIAPKGTYFHDVVEKVVVGGRRTHVANNTVTVKGPDFINEFVVGLRKNSPARFGLWRSMLRARMDAKEIVDTLDKDPIAF